jgi:hypothetical protein
LAAIRREKRARLRCDRAQKTTRNCANYAATMPIGSVWASWAGDVRLARIEATVH